MLAVDMMNYSELKGEDVAVELNGEEIYKVKCESGNKFDIKLVGPPHRSCIEILW